MADYQIHTTLSKATGENEKGQMDQMGLQRRNKIKHYITFHQENETHYGKSGNRLLIKTKMFTINIR